MTATAPTANKHALRAQRKANVMYWRHKLSGRPLFPCKPGQKVPAVKWTEEATNEKDILLGWLGDDQVNWAAAMGGGIFAIDLDTPAAREAFEARFGKIKTLTVRTPRGWHSYFRAPKGLEVRNSTSQLGEKIDVRGDGGYVLIPPSVTPNGDYAIEGDPAAPIVPAPPELLEALTKRPARAARSGNGAGRVPKGRRNSHLASLAGVMRRQGATEWDIVAELELVNAERTPG